MRYRATPPTLLSFVSLVAACSGVASDPSTPAQQGNTPTVIDAGVPTESRPSVDASMDAPAPAAPKGPPPSALPFSFQRPDVGSPLTPSELETATDELIALLRDTSYFDFVDSRVHGWPETDPARGYWYGHWWSGVSVRKAGGKVTFVHSHDGTDNAGIHSSPYLEGACYAHLMWGDDRTGSLVRRMSRAYSAWILSMVRATGDSNPPLLARAFYRPNVESTERGRMLSIDYSASYPGTDAEPSEYVHIPSNPTFGAIYVKNKRSKDDIGHMLRAVTQTGACAPRLDAPGQADLGQMATLYASWARRVDAQGFVIETLDKNKNLWAPSNQLARYTTTGNLECIGALAVRLGGGAAAGNLNCGNGTSTAEKFGWSFLKNDARQILRSHHAAAVLLAYHAQQVALARDLLQGLAERVDLDMGLVGSPPSGFNPMDVATELSYAANVGLPLTSREVRWLHTRLHEAHVEMRKPAHAATYKVFDASTPDGTYPFDGPNAGLFHRDIGMLIGACASPYRNPAGRALFDCARLLAAF